MPETVISSYEPHHWPSPDLLLCTTFSWLKEGSYTFPSFTSAQLFGDISSHGKHANSWHSNTSSKTLSIY